MATVGSCLALHSYMATYPEVNLYFFIFGYSGVMCYVVNMRYNNTILHCMLHILGNIANACLFYFLSIQ